MKRFLKSTLLVGGLEITLMIFMHSLISSLISGRLYIDDLLYVGINCILAYSVWYTLNILILVFTDLDEEDD